MNSIEDLSVLKIINKFTDKMINQYMKMYTGIDTDFKFNLKLIDVTSREGYLRVSDSLRRDYDYVLFLIPNQTIPGKIYVNEETPFYNESQSEYLKNPYEVPFYDFTKLLKEDLKMLGVNLDSITFGKTYITCPADYNLSLNNN